MLCPDGSLCCRPPPPPSPTPSTSSPHPHNPRHSNHQTHQMSSPRHLYLFYRSDGRCIMHKPCLEDPSAPQPPPSPSPVLSHSSLWPLLQVFIQFARELQRGSVKRLVFRHPHQYTPPLHRFQHMPRPNLKPHSDLPVVVHVAHDNLFVVAITEQLPASQSLDLLSVTPAEFDQNQVFTIADFCGSLLDFLNQEQTAFLATLTSEDFKAPYPQPEPRHHTSENHDTSQSTLANSFRITHTSSASNSPSTTSDSNHTQLLNDEDHPTPTSVQPVVEINELRVSEFISKTQNLMRM